MNGDMIENFRTFESLGARDVSAPPRLHFGSQEDCKCTFSFHHSPQLEKGYIKSHAIT